MNEAGKNEKRTLREDGLEDLSSHSLIPSFDTLENQMQIMNLLHARFQSS